MSEAVSEAMSDERQCVAWGSEALHEIDSQQQSGRQKNRRRHTGR